MSLTEICVMRADRRAFRSKREARRRDFADEAAVLVLLHLQRVDLHDGEEPFLLDVVVERRLIAVEAVLVVFQPLKRSSARSAEMIL